jgi:DNA-binding transcriptional ArsR family regulator
MDRTETLLAFFKAMANESRLKIVGLLSARARSVQELARLLDLTEPTVSHHLQVLKEIGLVTVRAEGVLRWHSLEATTLTELNRSLLEPGTVPSLAPRKGDPESRVLSSFIEDGDRIKSIPASRRKRHVILKWLVRKFDEDRRYPESAINETIQRHYWDSATLRRELIGHRMMAREKSVYWRLPEQQWRGYEGEA